MDTYVILRRNGSRTAEDLEEAAAHTIHRRRFAATQLPRRFGWTNVKVAGTVVVRPDPAAVAA